MDQENAESETRELPRKNIVDARTRPSGHVFMKDALREGGVGNRFEFVMMGARRAYDLQNGEPPKVPRNGDNDLTVALREVRERKVDLDDLRERAIESLRRVVPESPDVPDP